MRAQLLSRRCMHHAEQVRRKMQVPVAVQLSVPRADGERWVLVRGWPGCAGEVFTPVTAGQRADRRPRRPDVACSEQLEQARDDWLGGFQVLAVGIPVEAEPVVDSPAALEIDRDDDTRDGGEPQWQDATFSR